MKKLRSRDQIVKAQFFKKIDFNQTFFGYQSTRLHRRITQLVNGLVRFWIPCAVWFRVRIIGTNSRVVSAIVAEAD